MTINILELFGGIGAATKALKQIYPPQSVNIVDYVEKDRTAVNAYNIMNDTEFQPCDIAQYHPTTTEQVDVLMHGSPCQDFSICGKQQGGQKGTGTRSSLLWETIRIIDELPYRPRYVVWENVKNVLSKKHRPIFDAYCEQLSERGYINVYQILNAKDYGLPQNRERLFCISVLAGRNQGIKLPQPQPLTLCALDFMNTTCFHQSSVIAEFQENKAYDKKRGVGLELCNESLEESTIPCGELKLRKVGMLYGGSYEKQWEQSKRVYSPYGLCPCITALSGGGTETKFLLRCCNHYIVRKLMPIEMWKLMGFSEHDYLKVLSSTEPPLSYTALKRLAGNSICVPVLEAIFRNLAL